MRVIPHFLLQLWRGTNPPIVRQRRIAVQRVTIERKSPGRNLHAMVSVPVSGGPYEILCTRDCRNAGACQRWRDRHDRGRPVRSAELDGAISRSVDRLALRP